MHRLRTKVIVALSALMVVGSIASYSISQDAPRQRGNRGGDRGADRGNRGQRFDPAAMRQRMNERMKEALRCDDEEWTVIEPRLSKVQELSQELRGGMFGGRMGRGMFGRRGGQGGPAPAEAGAEAEKLKPVAQARQDLQQALGKPTPDAADVKAKLTAYRAERQKVKQKLLEAQQQLSEILTVPQEGQLVLMMVLD